MMLVKDLKPNLKNISLQVIVLDIQKPIQTKDGHEIRTVRIADRSGSVNISIWNECGALLKEGDILRLNNCFTQIWKNQLQLKVSAKGSIMKCGEFMMIFNEQPDMTILSSDILKQIQEQQNGAATNGKSSANTAKNF